MSNSAPINAGAEYGIYSNYMYNHYNNYSTHDEQVEFEAGAGVSNEDKNGRNLRG